MKLEFEPNYKNLKISKSASAWYIDYDFYREDTQTYERVRKTYDLNRKSKSPTLKIKNENFKAMLEVVKEELDNGYNPFDIVQNVEVKKARVALTLKEGLEYYKENLDAIRNNTSSEYKTTINSFLSCIGENTKLTTINSEVVLRCLKQLEKSSHNGVWRNSTFNNQRIRLRTFFQALVAAKFMKENPIAGIKLRRKQVTETHEVFEGDDLALILQWLDKKSPEAAIFCRLIYYTCIRPNELRLLQVKHVNMKKLVITVPEDVAKNSTERYVNIDEDAIDFLNKLNLSARGKEEFLFFNSRVDKTGKVPLDRTTMYRRFLKGLESLELTNKGYTLYSLKHTSNVNKFNAGWTIAEICAANGHKSLVQTETYLKELMKFAPVNKKVPSIG